MLSLGQQLKLRLPFDCLVSVVIEEFLQLVSFELACVLLNLERLRISQYNKSGKALDPKLLH